MSECRFRPGWALIVALSIASASLASREQALAGSFCLAHGDSTYSMVRVEPDEADVEDLRFLWHWTDDTFPRRFEPSDWPPEPIDADLDRLAIRVVGIEGEKTGDLALIAAPASMWEEVPESLLPRWPVPKGGSVQVPMDSDIAWRLRLVGEGRGSWWADVRRGQESVALRVVPTMTTKLEVVDLEGNAVQRPVAIVRERPAGGRSAQRSTALLAAEQGVITLRSLPAEAWIALLVNAPKFVTGASRGPVADLPSRVVLERGGEIAGRLVDAEKQPVVGARVQAEAWPGPDVPALIRSRDVTDVEGRFELGPLPLADVHLGAAFQGFVPVSRRLVLEEPRLDIGEIVLKASVEAMVRVIDPDGVPVAGAAVSGVGIRPRTTDAEGLVTVPGLARDRSTAIEVRAQRYLPFTGRLAPPFDEVIEFTLAPAFRVIGRFVDAEAAPVVDASLLLEQGNRSERPAIEPDGTFELDLRPARAYLLTLASPATREVVVELAPGLPGTELDLGDIVAPLGRSVFGRLLRADDGSPVAGAEISTRRNAAAEPLYAWAFGDRLAARSDVDGRFRISGLEAGPATLRIEGSTFARRDFAFGAVEDEPETDLGDIELLAGSEVAVEIRGSRDAALDRALARLDLGNRWLEMDMLTAPVRDGRARFRHVPAGAATVTVLAGGDLVCETGVDVSADEETVEATCEAVDLKVTGTVTVAGEPVGPGILSWLVPGAEAPPGMILSQASPGGLLRQDVLGAGRPQVNVSVAPDGYFATEALRPGRWEVAWAPREGSLSKTRALELPERESVELALDFPGQIVSGRVETADGEPAGGARVRETTSGAIVFAAKDGTFRFTGLEAGERFVKARRDERESRPLRVDLVPGEPLAPILLTLLEPTDDGLTIIVVDTNHAPVVGALVFVELEDDTRILTTDGDGDANLRLDPPFPVRLRVAVHGLNRWALGGWLAWREAMAEAPILALGDTGSLTMVTEERSGVPQIVDASGWDVTMLLSRLGVRPRLSAGLPLVIEGLPVGSYGISLGDQLRITTTRSGEVAEVAFE